MVAFKKPVQSGIWIGLALFLATFGIYCATLSRTVGFIDSGELVWVSATLGIPHPTGYPLYTLLTHLLVFALPFFEPIVAVNLFSAVAVSAATAGFFLSYPVLAAIRAGKKRPPRVFWPLPPPSPPSGGRRPWPTRCTVFIFSSSL